MSRSSAPTTPSTTVTTPDQSPGGDDDIWADDGQPSHHPDGRPTAQTQEMLSDLPTIRRQHMTDGYREGLSVGKSKVMQSGFDAGYPIGVEVALRAGKVLGFLEGYLAPKDSPVDAQVKGDLEKLYEKAKFELDVKNMLKGVSDEVINDAKNVQGLSSVETVLRKWEDLVLEVEKVD